MRSAGTEEPDVTKRRPAPLRQNLVVFSQGQHIEAVVHWGPRLYPMLTAKLGSGKVSQRVLVLKT